MNNSKFDYGCHNNLKNCTFALINYELNEISYLKKYQSSFHREMFDFLSCGLLEQEIKNEFNTDLLKLKIDHYYGT